LSRFARYPAAFKVLLKRYSGAIQALCRRSSGGIQALFRRYSGAIQALTVVETREVLGAVADEEEVAGGEADKTARRRSGADMLRVRIVATATRVGNFFFGGADPCCVFVFAALTCCVSASSPLLRA
jgi:hypothetical protein